MGQGMGNLLNICNKRKLMFTHMTQLIKNQNKTQLLDNQYDTIMLWHVLEHISDIEDGIFTLRKKLKNDGAIVVAVPNRDSFDSKAYKKYWLLGMSLDIYIILIINL